MAVWQSLRPKADKRKELKETPIPADKLSKVLPLWDSISTEMTSAKANIDIVAAGLEKEQPNSLATAGASSAQLRTGKLVKCTKVRDLPKSRNAIGAAMTKVNLAWAGIETQKNSKACQDLVPIIEGVIASLKGVQEDLGKIDTILNPRPGAPGFEVPGTRKRFKKAADRFKAFEAKKKVEGPSSPMSRTPIGESRVESADTPLSPTKPQHEVELTTPQTLTFDLSQVGAAAKSQTRQSYMDLATANKVSRV